jgi:Immunoglobulin I-set domain
VAVGLKGRLSNGQYSSMNGGVATEYPQAEMLVAASATPATAPRITTQPRSLRVPVGSSVGFAVSAEGVAMGFQWRRNGQVIVSPNGYNESTVAALRLPPVTLEDGGTYDVTVFNQAGSVTSVPVTLEVVP